MVKEKFRQGNWCIQKARQENLLICELIEVSNDWNVIVTLRHGKLLYLDQAHVGVSEDGIMSINRELVKIRAEIDEIDQQILTLIKHALIAQCVLLK